MWCHQKLNWHQLDQLDITQSWIGINWANVVSPKIELAPTKPRYWMPLNIKWAPTEQNCTYDTRYSVALNWNTKLKGNNDFNTPHTYNFAYN